MDSILIKNLLDRIYRIFRIFFQVFLKKTWNPNRLQRISIEYHFLNFYLQILFSVCSVVYKLYNPFVRVVFRRKGDSL